MKIQRRTIFLTSIASLLFCSLAGASNPQVTDSMHSATFNYHHLVEGDLDNDAQVDKKILSASPGFKKLFEDLFNFFSEIKHPENLKVKICSDLRVCMPSRYQPSKNTLFIQLVDEKNPTGTASGIAVGVHEYTHRVFHSLMLEKDPNISTHWSTFEAEKLSNEDKERFLNFLNLSYIPLTELVADFVGAVFLDDANAMTILSDGFRGFRFSYTQSDDFFFDSKVIGRNGYLIPNAYLILVPFRNSVWDKCALALNGTTEATKKKIIMNVINNAIALNMALYSKAFGAGLTREDLFRGVRTLCP